MGRKFLILRHLAVAAVVSSAAANAQDTVTIGLEPVTQNSVSAEKSVTIPAFTIVDLEILAPLNSKTSKMGEMFAIRLAEPIVIDGKTIVAAGALGQGEIIHAAKARAAGKAGEMILAARYIEHDGQKIMLRSFKYGASTGKSNRGEAFAAGAIIAAPLTLLIAGGNVDIPMGTRAHAKTAVDQVFMEGANNEVQ
jgi:hypothetical protein